MYVRISQITAGERIWTKWKVHLYGGSVLARETDKDLGTYVCNLHGLKGGKCESLVMLVAVHYLLLQSSNLLVARCSTVLFCTRMYVCTCVCASTYHPSM